MAAKAMRPGSTTQNTKPGAFDAAKPAPEPPMWDPCGRLRGARQVTKEEAMEARRKAAEFDDFDMLCSDGVVSVVVVTPVPTDLDLDCRPMRVAVGGFREEAVAYYMER
ncbi:MAG: hypothetical protein AB1529_01985 [Candidatus Micrarchaeota archaeon]